MSYEYLQFRARREADAIAYKILAEEHRELSDAEMYELSKDIYDKMVKKEEQEKRDAYLASFPLRYRDASFTSYTCESERMQQIVEFMKTGKSAIIYGPNGTGKTLLAFCSIRHQLEQEKSAAYLLAADFFDEIRHSFGGGDSLAVLEKYAKLDYLVVDEVDKTHGSQTEFIYLYRLVNMRYSNLLHTVLIGNSPNKQDIAEVIGASAVSRIASEGMVIQLAGKNWRLNG